MRQDFFQKAPLKILVIDDHELILEGSLDVIKQQYPEAKIFTAKTARDAIACVQSIQPNLAIVDLSIPEESGMIAQIDTGIQLLQQLMKTYPHLNFMVQSSYIKALIRIRHDIEEHKGGFSVADKGLSTQEILNRVNWALLGFTHTKDLQTELEVKPEWLDVLRLAFEEGLQDKIIAERMHVAERTVRHYWTKIQDVLGVYPDEGKNIRIQTERRAREAGLID